MRLELESGLYHKSVAALVMIEVKSQQFGTAAALYAGAHREGFVGAWLRGAEQIGHRQRLLGGRGDVVWLEVADQTWVCRHYRRGGLIARLLHDTYLWCGAERTRCFREFRLLTELQDLGLPAPAPVAARYQRQAYRYRADLITVALPAAVSLAEQVLAEGWSPALAAEIGRLIARFHRHGIWHADLNAHNILHSQGCWYLIDFDRGRRRSCRRAWRYANLQRLQRSLLKLGVQSASAQSPAWMSLLQAYRQEFEG